VAERTPAEDFSDVPVNPDNQVVVPELACDELGRPLDPARLRRA
jgi:hypothetical protein